MPTKEALTRAQKKYDSTKRKENRITIRVSKSAYAKLKQFALLKNISLIEAIEYLSNNIEAIQTITKQKD